MCIRDRFIYDKAGNTALLGLGACARSTNYWLGDIAPYDDIEGTIGDGYVDASDNAIFSATYGKSEGKPGFNPHADIGPTHDHKSKGIPLPDDNVEFEDMMIFAMNYGVVTPD